MFGGFGLVCVFGSGCFGYGFLAIPLSCGGVIYLRAFGLEQCGVAVSCLWCGLCCRCGSGALFGLFLVCIVACGECYITVVPCLDLVIFCGFV